MNSASNCDIPSQTFMDMKARNPLRIIKLICVVISDIEKTCKMSSSSGSLPSPTRSTLDPPYSPTKSEMEGISPSSSTADFSLGSSPMLLPSEADQHEETVGIAEIEHEELGEELTVEDIAALNEIDVDGIEDNISAFLRGKENRNTKASTEAIVSKYNRVMSLVAKKTKKDFVPLENTPRDEIPNLLAKFFQVVRTKKGEVYNASSYNTFLSCFGRYLSDAFEPPIDMKKEVAYKVVRKMIAQMKKAAQATKGKKPGAMAARAIAPRHIQLAWASGAIGRTTPDALNAAGYLAFTTGLGCRAVQEVTKVPNRAVIFGPIDVKYGLPEWIELDEEWVCKNRQGNDPRRLEARINPDHDNPESCMVRTILELQRRKQDKQKLPDKRFWWNIYEPARADPETHEKWYKNCVMGRHTMAKLLINALEKSGVDCKAEKYTATSARKTMMDGGLDAGIPEVLLERKAGQRTDKAKNSYIQNKDVTHRATNITLSRVGRGLNPKYQEILNKLVQDDSDALAGAVANKGGLFKEKDVHQDPQYLFDNDDADEEGFGTTISQSRMEESKERAEQGVSHHPGGGITSAEGGSTSAGEGSTSAGHNQAVRSFNQFDLNLMGSGTSSYQGAAFHPGFGQNTLAYNQSTMPPFELFRQHGNQFQLLSQQHQMPQMLMNQFLQQQQMILLQQPNHNLIQMLQQ